MANFLDYLLWRGDLSFRERPFNEVDNLILSELAYMDMDGFVPADGSGDTTLSEVYGRYLEAGRDQSHMINDPLPLLEQAALSERFGNLRLRFYVSETDTEKQYQFSAVTFFLDDDSLYLAYRGTDTSIVGWREDLNMGCLSETPGQLAAVDYLNRVAESTSQPLRVGGHSKGGNFAAYAAAFCKESVQAERILQVYSNDGPGFSTEVTQSEGYGRVLDRIALITPESSLVGILLNHKEERQVVKSSASGILQHNPYSWMVRGTAFEHVDQLSPASMYLHETLKLWIDGLSEGQRLHVVSAVFDPLDAAGAATLEELGENKLTTLGSVLKAASRMDEEIQKDFIGAIRSLAQVGTDVLRDEMKNAFAKWEAERAKKGE